MYLAACLIRKKTNTNIIIYNNGNMPKGQLTSGTYSGYSREILTFNQTNIELYPYLEYGGSVRTDITIPVVASPLIKLKGKHQIHLVYDCQTNASRMTIVINDKSIGTTVPSNSLISQNLTKSNSKIQFDLDISSINTHEVYIMVYLYAGNAGARCKGHIYEWWID